MRKALIGLGLLLRLLKDNPTAAATLASVVVMVAAYLGFDLDAGTLLAIGAPVVAVANGIVWFLVTPTHKLEATAGVGKTGPS